MLNLNTLKALNIILFLSIRIINYLFQVIIYNITISNCKNKENETII